MQLQQAWSPNWWWKSGRHRLRGNIEKAKQAQFRLAPLRIAFELGSFVVVIKDALKLIAIDDGSTREPIKSISGIKKEAGKGGGLLLFQGTKGAKTKEVMLAT